MRVLNPHQQVVCLQLVCVHRIKAKIGVDKVLLHMPSTIKNVAIIELKYTSTVVLR